jgi:hypothetical protein
MLWTQVLSNAAIRGLLPVWDLGAVSGMEPQVAGPFGQRTAYPRIYLETGTGTYSVVPADLERHEKLTVLVKAILALQCLIQCMHTKPGHY